MNVIQFTEQQRSSTVTDELACFDGELRIIRSAYSQNR